MLILRRRVTESVMIGDEVMITVLGVKGSQVRIGIDAPKHLDGTRRTFRVRKGSKRMETPDSRSDKSAFCSGAMHR